jgi:hypothetical protein
MAGGMIVSARPTAKCAVLHSTTARVEALSLGYDPTVRNVTFRARRLGTELR